MKLDDWRCESFVPLRVKEILDGIVTVRGRKPVGILPNDYFIRETHLPALVRLVSDERIKEAYSAYLKAASPDEPDWDEIIRFVFLAHQVDALPAAHEATRVMRNQGRRVAHRLMRLVPDLLKLRAIGGHYGDLCGPSGPLGNRILETISQVAGLAAELRNAEPSVSPMLRESMNREGNPKMTYIRGLVDLFSLLDEPLGRPWRRAIAVTAEVVLDDGSVTEDELKRVVIRRRREQEHPRRAAGTTGA